MNRPALIACLITLCLSHAPAAAHHVGATKASAADRLESALPLTARGNEPGWVLVIDANGVRLSTEAGTAETWAPSAAEAGAEARALILRPSPGVTVRLDESLCHDTMTGMPFPWSVKVERAEGMLSGCGGDPAHLMEGAWTLSEMAGVELPEGAEVTLEAKDGRVAGKAACNRYSGNVSVTGEGLALGPMMSTRMACEQPIMQLETEVLARLSRVSRFDISPEGGLILLAGDDTVLAFVRAAD